jgi:hypothetical protein
MQAASRWRLAAGSVLLLCGGSAHAQMYHLYLHCEGSVAAGPGATTPAQAAQTAVTPRGGKTDGRSAGATENAGAPLAPGAPPCQCGKRGSSWSWHCTANLVVQRNVLPTRQAELPGHAHARRAAAPVGGGLPRMGQQLFFYPPFQKMQATLLGRPPDRGARERHRRRTARCWA